MTVVPNNTGEQYGAIKKKLYCEHSMPSQVMTSTVLKKVTFSFLLVINKMTYLSCFQDRGIKAVATKVAIQMAAKLGAEPWSVKIPVRNLMVVGFDSYHDSAEVSSQNNR